MTRVMIDRFEGTCVIVESEAGVFQLPRALLPADAREGSVLRLDLQIDADETERQRRAVDDRRQRLAQEDDGGDFAL